MGLWIQRESLKPGAKRLMKRTTILHIHIPSPYKDDSQLPTHLHPSDRIRGRAHKNQAPNQWWQITSFEFLLFLHMTPLQAEGCIHTKVVQHLTQQKHIRFRVVEPQSWGLESHLCFLLSHRKNGGKSISLSRPCCDEIQCKQSWWLTKEGKSQALPLPY